MPLAQNSIQLDLEAFFCYSKYFGKRPEIGDPSQCILENEVKINSCLILNELELRKPIGLAFSAGKFLSILNGNFLPPNKCEE